MASIRSKHPLGPRSHANVARGRPCPSARPPASMRCLASTLEDPGGHRARLDHVFGRTHHLKAEEVRHILFRRTNRVYDVDLDMSRGRLVVLPSTHLPEKDTKLYMEKLKAIVAALNRWNVGLTVKEFLESIEGPVTEAVYVDLGIAARTAEFEIGGADI